MANFYKIMKNKTQGTDILAVVNEIMRKIPGLGRQDSLWLQDYLHESVRNLVKKGSVGKEAISELLYQRKPPHNIEAESAMLGKILLFPGKTMPLCTDVTPEYFYDNRHTHIWASILELNNSGHKVSISGIVSILTSKGNLENAGGKRYIQSLEKEQSSIEDVEDRIEEVRNLFVLRSLWQLGAEMVHDCYDISPYEVDGFRNKVVDNIGKLSTNSQKKYSDGKSLSEQLKQLKEKKILAATSGSITGHQSPIAELDLVTDGWQDTDLIIVAARPGIGKTAFMISDAAQALKNGEPIVIFSMEMSALQLAGRLFCAIKNYNIKDLLRDVSCEQAFDEFVEKELPLLPIVIDDTPGVHWRYIQDKVLYFKQKYGIKRIYVDYLQLMSPVNQNMSNAEQIISENSRGMKIIAKITGCPLMCLSQLSRECEKRSNKRPILSDLRSSGAIEQDADMVIFLYRDEYYKIYEDDEGNSTRGIAEIDIAKHRAGELRTVKAFFNAPFTTFGNINAKPVDYGEEYNQQSDDDFDWEKTKKALQARLDQTIPIPENEDLPF